MAVASASPERIDFPPPSPPMMDRSPSRSLSGVASESADSFAAASQSPDRNDSPTASPNPNQDSVDSQSAMLLRSEEYRHLFRLPPDEVLVQDFNCAYQENILLQGHMYIFGHYICFYSNIFGFETKKIIPFSEISSVKKAKIAGIFPNAIEIYSGGKKYFFASFLSRDEAFKLINDGWLQYGTRGEGSTDQQESVSGPNAESGNIVIEKMDSFEQGNELDSNSRLEDASPSVDSGASPDVEGGPISIGLTQVLDIVKQDKMQIENAQTLFPTKARIWNVENVDAPEIPKHFTKVAESKFPISTEEFFNLFCSDDAISFIESFHRKCGDKEFRYTSWAPHEKFGHARNISFQHPIKIYLGAKYGSCQVVQKFRVYRNSHLVIGTSQEISDVPYGDYFRVEGLWDVVNDGDETKKGCILNVYVDVAFSKKTVFKGKIVQSTLEECREAYALWIEMAHELLKQKNLEKGEETSSAASTSQIGEANAETEVKIEEAKEMSHVQDSTDHVRHPTSAASTDITQQVENIIRGNFINATETLSLLVEYITKFLSFLRNQSQISIILVIAFTVIFLMQVSIVVLLNRPQTVHVVSPGEYYMGSISGGVGEGSAETVAWLERRMHHLKDEMLMVEARLDRLQQESSLLKAQLKDFDKPHKHK